MRLLFLICVNSFWSYVSVHWHLLCLFDWVSVLSSCCLVFLLFAYKVPYLAIGFTGIHISAFSLRAFTKFSYSSFRIFLSVTVYWYLLSILVSENQSYRENVNVRFLFLHRLRRIFAETNPWSEDTPSKKESVSKYKALLIHFLFINIWSNSTSELLGWSSFVVFLPFFWNLVFRHAILFSNEKTARYSPLLFGEFCRQNLSISSLPIWAFMSPPMIITLYLGMCRTREEQSM